MALAVARRPASIAAEITGHEDVPKNNENALLQAVAQQLFVDGGGHDFMFYKSGVFNGDCGTAQATRVLTVMGLIIGW
ncbi:hypothetical protein D5086_008174 [Populus alba]|uniref:Uncharacterized protein n=1 Tax=Populus alba TaxID=43335 RepID=A0ACC4CF50_POPAL